MLPAFALCASYGGSEPAEAVPQPPMLLARADEVIE